MFPEEAVGFLFVSELTDLVKGTVVLCEVVFLLFKVVMVFSEVFAEFLVILGFVMVDLLQVVFLLGVGVGYFSPEDLL